MPASTLVTLKSASSFTVTRLPSALAIFVGPAAVFGRLERRCERLAIVAANSQEVLRLLLAWLQRL